MAFGSSLILSLTIVSTSTETPALDAVQELERALVEHPGDVDVMVQLALTLAREGERTRARALAEQVIERAPEYWDAHILIARIDGWETRYELALARIAEVLEKAPNLFEARQLKADVELWSGQLEDARSSLQALLERGESADLYFRLAQVEYGRLHYWAAWQAATRALELDPLHRGALAMRDEITLVRFELFVELEHLPVDGPQLAEATYLSVTLLPAAFFSLTIVEELRYRFGDWNQFLSGQIDYRPTRRVRLGALGGFGAPAPAISQSAASGWIGLEVLEQLDVRASYRYDRIGLPGDLHRASVDAGLKLPFSFRAEMGYTLAFVSAEEPGLSDLHGVRARLNFEPGRLAAHVEYNFGSQVDRPVVVLTELQTHDLSLGVRLRTYRWLELMLGLGVQFRRSEIATGEAFRGGLGVRVSL